jgi:hypothetical protein
LLKFYRGHVVIMLVDELLSAEISERESGFPFPVKVSATWEEGEAVLYARARKVIDVSFGCHSKA